MADSRDCHDLAGCGIGDDREVVGRVVVCGSPWHFPLYSIRGADGVVNNGGCDALSLHTVKGVTGVVSTADCCGLVRPRPNIQMVTSATNGGPCRDTASPLCSKGIA